MRLSSPVVSLALCFVSVCATSCRGKIYAPDKIAAEMLPVLIDVEIANRAERCAELTKDLTDFKEGFPYDIVPTGSDSIFCKGISKSKPDQRLHGGFMLPSFESCTELPKEMATELKRHENNLNAKIALACGADSKIKMDPDASVQLAARISLRERLATTVKAANAGTISSEISACYFGVKQEMMKSAASIRSSRCQAITEASSLKSVTYDAIWTHSHITQDFEEYRKAHEDAWDKAVKDKTQTLFLDMFTADAKASACATVDSLDVKALKLAAHTAQETCM